MDTTRTAHPQMSHPVRSERYSAGRRAWRSRQRQSGGAPTEWRPSLDEVAEDIKQRLTEAKAQQELNRLSRQLSDVLDARLFIACVALKKLLPEPEQIAFEQEQALWLMERIRLSKAAVSSPKGSLGPLEYSDEFNAVTEKRLREIEGRTATAKPPTKKR